jgi:hypothetical protein
MRKYQNLIGLAQWTEEALIIRMAQPLESSVFHVNGHE